MTLGFCREQMLHKCTNIILVYLILKKHYSGKRVTWTNIPWKMIKIYEIALQKTNKQTNKPANKQK